MYFNIIKCKITYINLINIKLIKYYPINILYKYNIIFNPFGLKHRCSIVSGNLSAYIHIYIYVLVTHILANNMKYYMYFIHSVCIYICKSISIHICRTSEGIFNLELYKDSQEFVTNCLVCILQ